MKKCIVDGKPSKTDVCGTCRRFLEMKYELELDVLDNVLKYLRKQSKEAKK